MPEEQDKNDRDLTVPEILDLLEQKVWAHVGEVKNLVHPSDTERLAELITACDRRLGEVESGPRRERLQLARKRLHATAKLNEVLPMPVFEEVPSSSPRKRKRPRRLSSAAAMPGFEAYHGKIMAWLDKKHFSQSSLAQFLEVDPSYLSRAIRGERQNRDLFLKIEELTEISAPPEDSDPEDSDPEDGDPEDSGEPSVK